MKRASSTRRSFLRAVGAGFAGFPLLRMLEDSAAQAAGERPPLRFLTLYHPHGIAAEAWVMRSTDTESEFDLGFTEPASGALCSLSPLERHKAKLLVIEGLELMSNAGGHDSAGTILTGSRVDPAVSRMQNASLDQFLAVEQGLGAATRVTSIELAVGTDAATTGETLSYGAGGLPLPKILDPVWAFDRLFGGLVLGDDPATREAALRRKRQNQSLVDFLNAESRRLRARLGPTERWKLDQHLTALADLEKKLVPAAAAVTASACPSPSRPLGSGFPKLRRYDGGEPYFDAIADAHIDLVALAFACDVTRFATLFLGDLSYEGNPLGLPADNHGNVAHTYDGSPLGTNGDPVFAGTPSTWAPLAKINHYCYDKVARVMDRLTEYGVVDSTLLYATSDMGNPALHSTKNVPTVLGGGLNGHFRMGRRLRRATASNHLLVSIAEAFGAPIDSFGKQPNVADTTGPLPGLT
jgi:hypothetical protein